MGEAAPSQDRDSTVPSTGGPGAWHDCSWHICTMPEGGQSSNVFVAAAVLVVRPIAKVLERSPGVAAGVDHTLSACLAEQRAQVLSDAMEDGRLLNDGCCPNRLEGRDRRAGARTQHARPIAGESENGLRGSGTGIPVLSS